MDTEDLSFAEGFLAMRGFILEEVEFPGLVLMPLKLELATELRLKRPLSLAELVGMGDVCDGESRPRSNFTAESGLSGSELLRLTLALFLAALLRNERSEFSISCMSRGSSS